jgi:hypothetical protein
MGRFTRWTIVTDMPYYRKIFANYVAIMSIILQMPNIFVTLRDTSASNSTSVGAVIAVLATCVVAGGSYMLYSFYNRKYALRDLAMLPASNLEKFLVRYLTSLIINLVVTFVSIVIADVLQYLVGLIIHRQPLGFVLSDTWNVLSAHAKPSSAVKGYFLICFAIWLHTYFMMGANLFRSIKYGWAFSSLFLLAFFILLIQIDTPDDIFNNRGDIGHFINNNLALVNIILLVFSIFQAWLSFKLFCSRQLIGKFFSF